jgi:hypothetical protein
MAGATLNKGRALFSGTFLPLLVALLGLLVAAPLVEEWPLITTGLVSLVLIAGAFAVHHNPLLRKAVILALVMVLGVRWLAQAYGERHHAMVVGSHLMSGSYLLMLGAICMAVVLSREQITRDTVVGAVCGYILVAYVFAFGYAILEDLRPGSFTWSTNPPAHGAAGLGDLTQEFVYFSFVTLTTTGYGEIVPASRGARSLAIIEMLAGPLYLAAFVARMVAVMSGSPSGQRDGTSGRSGGDGRAAEARGHVSSTGDQEAGAS